MALIEMFSFVFLQYEQKNQRSPNIEKDLCHQSRKPRFKKMEKKKTPENRDYSRNRIETVIATTTGD